MALLLQDGVYVLGPNGLPVEIHGLAALLQDVRLLLELPRGAFPYGPGLGSRLDTLDPAAEHAAERAQALAAEALLELPGVQVTGAAPGPEGSWDVTLSTPLGTGVVRYTARQKGALEHGGI